MGAELLAAGIGALGSIASSLLTNASNQGLNAENFAYHTALNQQNFEYQKQLQDRSADLTSYLMDFENQYNTPSEQMKRLQQAGLNPYALMNNAGAIGSGNSQGSRGVSPGSVSPSSFNMIPNQAPDLGSVADKIFGASQIKSQRIAALSEFSKALPGLVKSVGKDAATRIASSFLGQDIDLDRIERMAAAEEDLQRIRKDHDNLLLSIDQEFGSEKARLINQNLSQEFDKLSEEILNLGSEREVNDAKIKELVTSAAKNLAEKAHLNADTATINKLRDALYYEAKGRASSAYARGQMDTYDSLDRKAKFEGDTYQRDLDRLVGTPDDKLSTSQRVLKKAVLVERRLGKVAKNLSPLNP